MGGAYYLINFFNCAALLAKKSSKSSNNFNDTAKTRDFLPYKKNYCTVKYKKIDFGDQILCQVIKGDSIKFYDSPIIKSTFNLLNNGYFLFISPSKEPKNSINPQITNEKSAINRE